MDIISSHANRGRDVRLITRGGHNWTEKFPKLAVQVGSLPVNDCWLDGELVYLDENGYTDFEALQAPIAQKDESRLYLQAFDLPFRNLTDLTRTPLLERKEILIEVLAGEPNRIRYSAHFIGGGPAVFRHADELNYEGIVSKRVDSPYRPGERSRDWQKVKSWRTYEVPLLGLYLDRDRKKIEALLVGTPNGSGEYGGRIEAGLHQLAGIREDLIAAGTAPAPFEKQSGDRRRLWFESPVPIEIKALPWIPGKKLRHASLLRT